MICVSIAIYALAKELGAAAAKQEFMRQLNAPGADSLPSVRTLARLRELGDVRLVLDAGATSIAKTRSRAAFTANQTASDIWVSVDDDVEVDGPTLRDLLEAVAGDDPAVCVAPCWLRGAEVVAIAVAPGAVATPRGLPSGGQAVPILAAGFGCVAVNRACLAAMVAGHPELAFVDDDSQTKVALFLEDLARERWWGEDLWFFRRTPPGARVEALIQGATIHDGQALDLATIPERSTMNLIDWGPAPDAAPTDPPPALDDAAFDEVEEAPPAA